MSDWIVILVIILVVVLFACSPRDDSDPKNGKRSGLTIYTDNLTGCQYIKGGFFGGITPRLDENGKHICRK